MNIIVTCGPSYEPIDEVRRLTNFSTGRLGITLANAFTAAGHKVHCLKGEQATDPTEVKGELTRFSTNDDLASKLKALGNSSIDAIFHAAALCDFKVASVENAQGEKLQAKKFPTRGDELTLRLAPTTKVLPQLRGWFPDALIVGWKYEMTGSREEILDRAFKQITDARTNACVLNGAAYGAGFGLCMTQLRSCQHLPDLDKLCARLLSWTTELRKGRVPPL